MPHKLDYHPREDVPPVSKQRQWFMAVVAIILLFFVILSLVYV